MDLKNFQPDLNGPPVHLHPYTLQGEGMERGDYILEMTPATPTTVIRNFKFEINASLLSLFGASAVLGQDSMASLQQLPAATRLWLDAGMCIKARRKYKSSSSVAEFSGRTGAAFGRSFHVVALFNVPSSFASFEYGARLKDAGRILRKFWHGYEEVLAGNVTVADGKDGQCKRPAMAAVFFIALSVLQEQAVSAEAMRGFVPIAFPWESAVQEQSEPSKGTCATCIGVVDETLGICSATANCVSSFDDRPRFFVAPWEFPGQLPFAVDKLRNVLLSSGAKIEEEGERYVHAVFTSKDGIMDDVEFLFSNPREDATVVIRSASRAINIEDKERNRKRLEEIRKSLTWEQVPVLRNRKRALFFLESPWDTFGPEPPPSPDYKDNLEIAAE